MFLRVLICILAGQLFSFTRAAEVSGAAEFHKDIEPVIRQYCYDCHGDGAKKGGVAFDEFASDQAILTNRDLWWTALKYLRAGIMPPPKRDRPTPAEQLRIAGWIKSAVFAIDPKNIDPGRVTLRRLNRVEYRNSIRDLLGVDFDAETEFPPDDSGYGFDNIGDVLTLSPMLFEKYIAAAKTIVTQAVKSKNSNRFFSGTIPEDPAGRREYVRQHLRNFATKAFRRPVDDETVDRLASLAEEVYSQPGKNVEAGIAQGMEAVISSPRFLFHLEGGISPAPSTNAWSPVDDYALASRLSYFLWSTMPDDELFRLAGQGQLRNNLAAQVQRMLKDPRSKELVRNFTGQWLQARDVEYIAINAKAVLARDSGRDGAFLDELAAFRGKRDAQADNSDSNQTSGPAQHARPFRKFQEDDPPLGFDHNLRQAMRNETEMFFASVVQEDRDVATLIDSDYTFLNERLAALYGLTNLNITGNEMRRVTLPPDSPRGGVLTEGTVLVVTSNPDRTSPVKRGVFVLSNILGTPPPPPPPNVPALEASEKGSANHGATLRDLLEAHRSQPLCASCHARMDPIGLAMENFNALGIWRDTERNQNIDAAGKLITGESFNNVRELKHILATKHREDFYRCLTEKLLTYALGRGLEYYDVETVDEIVQRLDQQNGRFSALLMGIIESAPFQKQRNQANPVFAYTIEPTKKSDDATVARN